MSPGGSYADPFGPAVRVTGVFVVRSGCSAAALRYPAPLTVRPLRPVVAFAGMRLTLSSPDDGESKARLRLRLPDFVRCDFHVAIRS